MAKSKTWMGRIHDTCSLCRWSPDIWCWIRAVSDPLGGKDVFGINNPN